MRQDELLARWRAEERAAHIHGWDFSYIEGRYSEEALPWDYRAVILRQLRPEMKLLDIDTGGGEFLLSLNHPHRNISATEAYPPNAALCRETLLPLGIDFREADGGERLPFDDGTFDMVINRHGNFNAREIHRVLKDGGMFITQQVGAENDRELVELLLGKIPLPFPEQYLSVAARKFREAGFTIADERECFRPIRFYDIGALVWFARVIEWEFPNFSVDACMDSLLGAQWIQEKDGFVQGRIHRFLLAAKK
ncbi:MAG: class I SAM-dependent methyltransferase [Clostridia bacterium]|nr:class I SAM-dependent methyltransferase [Clostridia bacterium]